MQEKALDFWTYLRAVGWEKARIPGFCHLKSPRSMNLTCSAAVNSIVASFIT
ncbi:MAG: hypothetical protein JWO49_3000 [Arthrobacter sp.]|nr:hypothetical protein [Arthrobacter sp.]